MISTDPVNAPPPGAIVTGAGRGAGWQFTVKAAWLMVLSEVDDRNAAARTTALVVNWIAAE